MNKRLTEDQKQALIKGCCATVIAAAYYGLTVLAVKTGIEKGLVGFGVYFHEDPASIFLAK